MTEIPGEGEQGLQNSNEQPSACCYYSLGASGAPPTCKWLKSRSVP
jgi:hypothetical protein